MFIAPVNLAEPVKPVETRQPENPPEGQLDEHKVVPITHYILIVGAIVGVVTAIAAAIFNQIPLIIAGVVMGVCSSIGAVEIKRLAYVKEMDQVNKEINQDNIDFYKENLVLKSQIEQMKNERLKFHAEIVQHKKIIAENESRIKAETNKIKELIAQVNLSKQELESLPAVFNSLKTAMISFEKVSSEYIQDSKLKQQSIEKLFAKIVDLGTEDKQIENEGKLFGNHIANLKLIVQDISKIVPAFEKILQIMQQSFKDVKSENFLLKQQIEQFQATITQLSNVIEQMKINNNNYQQVANSLQKYDFKELNKKLDEEISLLKFQKDKALIDATLRHPSIIRSIQEQKK
jgi:chromosome segregation ATPase